MHILPHSKDAEATEPVKLTMEEKVDKIVHHLERMDKRDRLRTIGGFIKGVLGFIPLLVMLGSLWYVYNHGAELMKEIASEAAKQAASYTQQGSSDIMKQFQNMMTR